jgi:hypothetical protein
MNPWHLLLAGPEEGQEAQLPSSAEALARLPPPVWLPAPASHLGDGLARADDLAAQGWGLVLPRDEDMRAIFQELEPLIALRERQQGSKVRTYELPPGLDERGLHAWCDNAYAHDGTPEHERPRYLLLVGDLEQLPLSLQQVLSTHAWVGRLAFDRTEDYGHYARKVHDWATRAGTRQAEALFYSVRDNSEATRAGHAGLIEPSHQQLRALQAKGKAPALALLHDPNEQGRTRQDFLEATATARPTVLLTISHGRGPPPEGWSSEQHQRATQGAMRFGFSRMITGEDIQQGPFLPGGFWLYFACFGAATPAVSQYQPWLEQLRQEPGMAEDATDLLRTLQGPMPRSFMAALPQRALANPEGPLGVIAHVDLTLSSSFQERSPGGTSRASRFYEPINLLVREGRVGSAIKSLALAASSTEHLLANLYTRMKRGQEVPPEELGRVWMLRQDLRGFVLLGDPAARLPLAPEL